jgi:GTPase
MSVLHDIGAEQVPQILVFNKLDAMDPAARPQVASDQMELEGQSVPRVYVSAHTGEGLPALRALLSERVGPRAAAMDPGFAGEPAGADEPLS